MDSVSATASLVRLARSIHRKARALLQKPPSGWRSMRSAVLAPHDGGSGGRGGIRTHGGLAPTPVFKTGALNHSTTHPFPGWNARVIKWLIWYWHLVWMTDAVTLAMAPSIAH